jgi:hypothetical protein
MQPTLQPAETHDAIVALLRDHPPRPAHDPSELNIVPGHEETAVTPQVEPAPMTEAAPAAAAPVHHAPAFEPIPPAPVAEPIVLSVPLEPALRATPSSDI